MRRPRRVATVRGGDAPRTFEPRPGDVVALPAIELSGTAHVTLTVSVQQGIAHAKARHIERGRRGLPGPRKRQAGNGS